MNEQTITKDRLAEEIDALLAPYPDPMSRNDFRQACHIGTRTSLYLLQSGLVPCIHTGKRTLDYEIVSRLLLRRHLEQQLADAPDVLTVEQIARFTGYTPHTVSRWCTEGRLHTIQRHPRFMVPKTWLLDYLVSDDYNRITRKSGKHYGMIQEVGQNISPNKG